MSGTADDTADDTADVIDDSFDIAVIGAGSAGEAFVDAMQDRGRSIVVFEPGLVGGECPFYACMPSKSMLHDVGTGRSWHDAVQRRDEIVSHLDDTDHAEGLRKTGATLVRERARIVADGVVRAGDADYRVDHVVIGTGAHPTFPDVDGLDPDHPRLWTSRDALTATERPDSVIVLGSGAIGCELAYVFAGFGAQVTALDEQERPVDDLHPRVGELVAERLTEVGVEVVTGVTTERVELADDHATVVLAGGRRIRADRLLVATGRAPTVHGVGLEALGVDPDHVEIDDRGAVVGVDGIWLAGDAAGRQQYTHVANHHATVIADQIAGDGDRRYGDVVVPACVFVDPPVTIVGPPWSELRDDDDVVWAEVDLDVPRTSTDEHGPGFVAVAARRSSGCIVAADGVGARFDEISHALVVAIDGKVPVSRLRETIQPFPTVGEVLAEVFSRLADQLDSGSRT